MLIFYFHFFNSNFLFLFFLFIGNKIHYRVTIYPSNDDDGEFNPTLNSRIFLRLNNHSKELNLIQKSNQLCPTFESGVKQTFELDLIQSNDEQLKKLTIGYVNSQNTARKWKLEKVQLKFFSFKN